MNSSTRFQRLVDLHHLLADLRINSSWDCAKRPAMLRGIAITGVVVLSCAGLALSGCATKDSTRSAPEQPASAATVAAVEPVKKAEEGPAPASGATKPWVVQPVAADTNANTRSVAEALKNNDHPERLSMLIPPKAFSAEAYAKDPKSYLDTVEPGRVFQTAQPGPTVPQLIPVGARAARVQPNGSVDLAVKTLPGQPVSWTSCDLGSFNNLLNAITVAADGEGIARVTFTATPGVSHVVRIIAGSPVASGQIQFQVDVQTQGIVPVSSGTGADTNQ